jgi:hypothetical protein
VDRTRTHQEVSPDSLEPGRRVEPIPAGQLASLGADKERVLPVVRHLGEGGETLRSRRRVERLEAGRDELVTGHDTGLVVSPSQLTIEVLVQERRQRLRRHGARQHPARHRDNRVRRQPDDRALLSTGPVA